MNENQKATFARSSAGPQRCKKSRCNTLFEKITGFARAIFIAYYVSLHCNGVIPRATLSPGAFRRWRRYPGILLARLTSVARKYNTQKIARERVPRDESGLCKLCSRIQGTQVIYPPESFANKRNKSGVLGLE